MTKQENKQLYLELLGLVEDKWPSDFADLTKMAKPDLKFATITNVRYGRSPKLDVLVFMIRECIPAFIIPIKYLENINELQAA